MDNVTALVNTNMTPEQTLRGALELPLTDVMVIGYMPDGSLACRSSKMNREAALWIIECAKIFTMREIIGGEASA